MIQLSSGLLLAVASRDMVKNERTDKSDGGGSSSRSCSSNCYSLSSCSLSSCSSTHSRGGCSSSSSSTCIRQCAPASCDNY